MVALEPFPVQIRLIKSRELEEMIYVDRVEQI